MAKINYGNVVAGVVLAIFAVSILAALGALLNSNLSEDQRLAGQSGGTVYNESLALNSTIAVNLTTCDTTRAEHSAKIGDASLTYVNLGNGSVPISAVPNANFTVSGCSVIPTATTYVYANLTHNFTYTFTYTADTPESIAINNSIAPINEITSYYGLWILAGGIAFAVVLFAIVFMIFGGLRGGDTGGGKGFKFRRGSDGGGSAKSSEDNDSGYGA